MDVYFRFSKLTKMQALTLEREVMFSSSVRECDDFDERTTTYIGLVLLNQQSLHDINDFFVRQKVELIHCALCLKKSSAPDIEESVPPIVNEMLHYIDCQLVVSGS